MVSAYFVRNIIGIIGNVISFFLFISPTPTFYTIIKRKDVEDFSPNPYLATVLNCAMWVYYGMPFVHPHSMLVVTINGFGLALELVYLAIYFIYSKKKQRLYVVSVLTGEVAFYGLVIGLTLGLLHTTARRSLVVGIVCTVFNIFMYGMPLDVIRLVIRTKSVEYLPFFLCVTNFVNSCIWLTYALLYKFDLYLTISNASGAALGLVQVLLHAIYYKTTPKRGTKKPSDEAVTEVQISSTTTDGRVMPAV